MAKGPIRLTRAGRSQTLTRPGLGTLDHALRKVRGGKHHFMDLAGLAIEFDPRVERAVVIWSQLTPWQRRWVTLEDLAAEANMKPSELLAAVVRASFEHTRDLTDLLVAAAFPGVVATSVRRLHLRSRNSLSDLR